jgi:glucose-1-phosphate cytidylyltransferase
MELHRSKVEPWRVTLIDTGEQTMTGGRLRRALPHVEGEEAFCFTYGDGLADTDVTATIALHRERDTLATITAVQPPGRFGALEVEGDLVRGFREKPRGDGGWINGGFFVLTPEVGAYLDGDDTVWEDEPLARLAQEGQLSRFEHQGFWQPMDTLRDKRNLQELWESGRAPWKVWDR